MYLSKEKKKKIKEHLKIRDPPNANVNKNKTATYKINNDIFFYPRRENKKGLPEHPASGPQLPDLNKPQTSYLKPQSTAGVDLHQLFFDPRANEPLINMKLSLEAGGSEFARFASQISRSHLSRPLILRGNPTPCCVLPST